MGNQNNEYKAKDIANKIEIFYMKNKKGIILGSITLFVFIFYLIFNSITGIKKEDLQTKIIEIPFETSFKETLMLFQGSRKIEEGKEGIIGKKKEFFDEKTGVTHFIETKCKECIIPKKEIVLKGTFPVKEGELYMREEINNFFSNIKNRRYDEAIKQTALKSRKNMSEDSFLNFESREGFKFNDFIIKQEWIRANLDKTDRMTIDITTEINYHLDGIGNINEILNFEAIFNQKTKEWEFDFPFTFYAANAKSIKLSGIGLKDSSLNYDKITISAKIEKIYKNMIGEQILKVKFLSSIPFDKIETEYLVGFYQKQNKETIERILGKTVTSLDEPGNKLYDYFNSTEKFIKKEQRAYERFIYIPMEQMEIIYDKEKESAKYFKIILKPEADGYADLPEIEISTKKTSVFFLK